MATSPTPPDPPAPPATDPPREVACPRCRSPLRRGDDAVECTSCHARYAVVDEVIDFLSQPEQKADRERRGE
jgi:LSD1 subclass zinc finger protein